MKLRCKIGVCGGCPNIAVMQIASFLMDGAKSALTQSNTQRRPLSNFPRCHNAVWGERSSPAREACEQRRHHQKAAANALHSICAPSIKTPVACACVNNKQCSPLVPPTEPIALVEVNSDRISVLAELTCGDPLPCYLCTLQKIGERQPFIDLEGVAVRYGSNQEQ